MLELDLAAALQEAQDTVVGWVEGLIANLPDFLAAALVLLLFVGIARVVQRTLRRVLGRFTTYSDVNRVIAGFASGAVILAGLFIALGILDLDKTVTSLLAGAGIIGIALGFAFQHAAENFIAGLYLNVRRQFTDGDIIETNEYTGVVETVEMRATVLRTFDGQRVLIPNGEVFKNVIVNYSALGTRRVDVPVGVSYGTDLARAREVAVEAVAAIRPRIEERDVEVFYEGFGESSINFTLRFWIPFRLQTDYLQARSEAVMRVKKAFDDADITIPFPIRTLDFSRVGGTELREAWPREASQVPESRVPDE